MVTPLTTFTDGIGTVSYNGVTLTPARNYKFEMEPIYDEAGIALVYDKYVMHGEWHVTSATEAVEATALSTIRRLLSEPGKVLTISGIGFGDMAGLSSMVVGGKQAGVTHYDVKFGPHPKVAFMEPVGGLIAWRVNWSVEFHLLPCTISAAQDGKAANGRIIAFNREFQLDIDCTTGLTRYTIAGYWQVALNRDADGENLTEGADKQIDKLLPVVPNDFERVNRNYHLSKDRTRVDFTVTDQELTGPAFPAGIVKAKIKYEVSTTTQSQAIWHATLSGSLTTIKGRNRYLAAQKFAAIARDKRRQLEAAFRGTGSVFPVRFSFSLDDLFGRTSSFSLTFQMAGTLRNIMQASGVWSDVPESNYQQWAASMQPAWHPRGLADAHFNKMAIIDVCGNDPLPVDSVTASGRPDAGGPTQEVFSCGTIDPKFSWLAYENHVRVVRKQSAVNHSFAQVATGLGLAYALTSPSTALAGGAVIYANRDRTDPKVDAGSSYQGKTPSVVQYQGAPDDELVMYGKAMRLQHVPVAPTLKQVMGIEPVLIDSSCTMPILMGRVGTDNCCVWGMAWAYRFKCPTYLDTTKQIPTSGAPNETCGGEH